MLEKYHWWSETQKNLADEAAETVRHWTLQTNEDARSRLYPHSVLKECGKLGWLGALIPQKYGGIFERGGVTGACILSEEMGRLGPVANPFINTMCNAANLILKFGNEEQQNKYIPCIAAGRLHAALAITEPYAGSDGASLESTVTKKEDCYILNGVKRFIANGGVADLYLVYASSGKPAGNRPNYSVFIIKKNAKGLSFSEGERALGYDGIPLTNLNFNDVVLASQDMIGAEGNGWHMMMTNLNLERLIAGAVSLGAMREALRYCNFHLQHRFQFNELTGDMQINQHRVADMVTDLTVSRLLIYHTAHLMDLGQNPVLYPAMSKLYTTEKLMRDFTINAVQCMGADGTTERYPVSRIFRDAKMNELAAGSSEIMRLLIHRFGMREMRDDLNVDLELPAYNGEDKETFVLRLMADFHDRHPSLSVKLSEIQSLANDGWFRDVLEELGKKSLVKLHRDSTGNAVFARITYEGLKSAKKMGKKRITNKRNSPPPTVG